MDILGSIKLIENRLGGRYPNQTKNKSASENNHPNGIQGKKRNAKPSRSSAWDEIQLGRNIDTTA